MKRNISELLDDLAVDDVLLSKTSELSSRRIKQKTMERVGVKKTINLRWCGRIAIVAAVIMLMTVSVFAADVMLNDKTLLGGSSSKEEPKKQVNVIGTLGRDFGYTGSKKKDVLTCNGATVTPISAISDGRILYLRIRLEAPEGTVLEDLPENMNYSFEGSPGSSSEERMKAHFYYESNVLYNVTVKTLPDEDPTDNEKEFILEIYAGWIFGFSGSKVRISIPGVWIKGSSASSSTRGYLSKLIDAKFEFEFAVTYQNEKMDLKNLGVTHYIEKYDFSVNLKRLVVTPLRLTLHYTATLPENEDILPDGKYAQIVIKDGTRLTYGDLSHVSDAPDAGYQVISKCEEYYEMDFTNVAREYNCDQTVYFSFDEPLVLEDIDYIVWCGGKIIDVN